MQHLRGSDDAARLAAPESPCNATFGEPGLGRSRYASASYCRLARSASADVTNEDKKWRMANRKWQMADRRMADDRWQMTDDRWRMTDGGWRMGDGGEKLKRIHADERGSERMFNVLLVLLIRNDLR
jgi:hypothetical protein